MRNAWVCGGVMLAAWAGCASDDQFDGGEASVERKSLPACKTKKHDKRRPKEKDCYTTTVVGPTGGVVEHPGGAILTVPAGALDSDVVISVLDQGASGPAGTQMFSPVF